MSVTTNWSSEIISELHVENVKSLIGSHKIPLAPLTLIYGPNSAGKSTILQSLMLFSQCVEENRFAPKGPLVNLGSFEQIVSLHDTSRAISLGIRFPVEEERKDALMLAELEESSETMKPFSFLGGIGMRFERDDERRLPYSQYFLEVEGATLSEPEEAIIVNNGSTGPKTLRWKVDLDPQSSRNIANVLQQEAAMKEGRRSRAAGIFEELALRLESNEIVKVALENWIVPWDWEYSLELGSQLRLVVYVEKNEQPAVVETLSDWGLFLGTPADEEADYDVYYSRPQNSVAGEAASKVSSLFRIVAREGQRVIRSTATNDPFDEDGCRPTSGLVAFGPVRPKPERVSLDDTGVALGVPLRRLYEDEHSREEINLALSRMDIPYVVSVDQVVAKTSGSHLGYTLELTDTRTGTDVSLADVGYGISQILPVIIECVTAEYRVICIEQPELHLHPRLAANLAEIFVESIDRGNQIIAETHSEDLLLRTQRMIREGRISADSVSLLYVDNVNQQGATVRQMPMNKSGDILERWPRSFDTRLEDLLGC